MGLAATDKIAAMSGDSDCEALQEIAGCTVFGNKETKKTSSTFGLAEVPEADQDGSFSNQTFDPSIKQYVGMLNIGGMKLSKGFGVDLFFGIGANYNFFESGNELDRAEYPIDNPLFEFRKDKYFGVFIRTGITMGLNFGPVKF